MNSEDQDSSDGETSRLAEESSSNVTNQTIPTTYTQSELPSENLSDNIDDDGSDDDICNLQELTESITSPSIVGIPYTSENGDPAGVVYVLVHPSIAETTPAESAPAVAVAPTTTEAVAPENLVSVAPSSAESTPSGAEPAEAPTTAETVELISAELNTVLAETLATLDTTTAVPANAAESVELTRTGSDTSLDTTSITTITPASTTIRAPFANPDSTSSSSSSSSNINLVGAPGRSVITRSTTTRRTHPRVRPRGKRTVTTQTSPLNQPSSPVESSIPSEGAPEIQSASTSSTAPSSSAVSFVAGGSTESDEMKRAAAKKLIERYFYQLLDGCGNPKCNNKFCASSGEVEEMTPNQAAARAIQLFSQDAKLCDPQPSKMARTSNVDSLSPSDKDSSSNSNSRFPRTQQSSSKYGGATSSTTDRDESSSSTALRKSKESPSDNSSSDTSSPSATHTSGQKRWLYTEGITSPSIIVLNEESVTQLVESCRQDKSFAKLIRTVGEVFSSCELLAHSFQKQPSATIDEMLQKAPKDLKSIKKEDLRTLEGDLDKDEDSSADKEDAAAPHNTTVDLPSLRRSIQKLFECECPIYEALNNGLHSLAIVLSVDLRLATQKTQIEKSIHVFVIVFEIMTMASSEFLEMALPNICKAAARLPVWAQARLARIWAEHCKSSLRSLLQTLQQLISLQVITGNFNRDTVVQDNEIITSTTKVLKIVYYANILAGKLEIPKTKEEESSEAGIDGLPDDLFFGYTGNKTPKPACLEDKLSTELGVSVLDCRTPLIPFEEFYNEPLSDAVEMDNDYLYYKNMTMDITTRLDKKFSFMLYSYILTPATKIIALYYDSRIRMYSERRISLFHTQLSGGQSPNPYLKLKVRRDQIIDDALVELEMIAMGNPKDLKKQLVVEFVGEQGIDEGGVSKEFFQLVVEQIFNPDYGMFIYQEDTKTVWFNSTSFENEAQFTLIGIVLGLAIYNNIILAVNFPMVVYRKLMGINGSFYDLADWNPVLFKGLQSMLEYEEPDMEEVFMQTFKISYKDVFGNTIEHELKPNGGDTPVTQENKQEFVDLYSDFLLNTSIEKQFRAFRKGFQMVTDESPLQLLFRPEEIELLVCGSKKFDFVELEKSTEYEGGYTEKSQIIVDFWSIVHALPIESKRKLLEFTTGSDRVPVGGLSRLKLVIARNGPDSDRLPTSHTCFNVLLLPEYENKEKLEDRLLKAINYSKGFGML